MGVAEYLPGRYPSPLPLRAFRLDQCRGVGCIVHTANALRALADAYPGDSGGQHRDQEDTVRSYGHPCERATSKVCRPISRGGQFHL
eukprot:scaffold4455_cov132-Isochrysis_galbana.AAC.8